MGYCVAAAIRSPRVTIIGLPGFFQDRIGRLLASANGCELCARQRSIISIGTLGAGDPGLHIIAALIFTDGSGVGRAVQHRRDAEHGCSYGRS